MKKLLPYSISMILVCLFCGGGSVLFIGSISHDQYVEDKRGTNTCKPDHYSHRNWTEEEVAKGLYKIACIDSKGNARYVYVEEK